MEIPLSTAPASMPAGQLSSHPLLGTDVPTDIAQMMQLAQELSKADAYVPPELRGKPANIVALMMRARGLNIPLSVAWDELYDAGDGDVGRTAKLVRALARRAGHDLEYVEHDKFHAIALLTLADGRKHEVRYTIQEAVEMGLMDPARDGSEDWERQPENMLVARVTTRAVNWYCPEVFLGIGVDRGKPEDTSLNVSTVVEVREERRAHVRLLLAMTGAAGQQPNGAVRMRLLREVFMRARDGMLLDFAADDSGEQSVRHILVDAIRGADVLAKAQGAGEAEAADPATGPQTLDDLRSLVEAEFPKEPEAAPEEPKAEEKPKRRRAAKKTAPAAEKTQGATAPRAGAPAKAKVPRARKAPAKKAQAAGAPVVDVQPGAQPPGSPAGRAADRPGGRVVPAQAKTTDEPRVNEERKKRELPCGCLVDDVIRKGVHADTCRGA
ncbi:hypothetical protein [Streptomyces sp. NPDC059278]|uniref:hypothetical protein n=1 Tax=Streptomyces sp. NPDC059278 TaxID=3346801 RepID=UPI0036A4A659